MGSRVFNCGGGGGGGLNRAPITGGGSGKRAQLTGPSISYHKLWCQRPRKFFSAFKMVKLFFTKSMANDDFSEPPRRADSKNPIFILLPDFGSRSPPRPGGQSPYDFWGGGRQLSSFGFFFSAGGGSLPECCIDLPPPEVETAPTLWTCAPGGVWGCGASPHHPVLARLLCARQGAGHPVDDGLGTAQAAGPPTAQAAGVASRCLGLAATRRTASRQIGYEGRQPLPLPPPVQNVWKLFLKLEFPKSLSKTVPQSTVGAIAILPYRQPSLVLSLPPPPPYPFPSPEHPTLLDPLNPRSP